NRKEIAKMNKKLQKNIEKRHKEEQKRQQEADLSRPNQQIDRGK
ncbi:hypothetical protein ACQKH8_14920, partial [Staphylococcus aureus]